MLRIDDVTYYQQVCICNSRDFILEGGGGNWINIRVELFMFIFVNLNVEKL